MKKCLFLFMLIMVMISCEEESNGIKVQNEKNSSISEQELYEFSFALAKSMDNPSVRAFIKKEALRQFDEDYDILFAMVKKQIIKDGEPFLNILQDHCNPSFSIEEITDKIPLLTIFVPELNAFSAQKWDVNSEAVPKVAIAINEAPIVTVVDNTGAISEVSSTETPDYPVIVVKVNERVNFVSKKDAGKINKKLFLAEDERHAYYLINERAVLPISETRNGTGSVFDTKVKNAMWKQCATCYHRDYIYYSISPSEGVNQGPLDNTFTEALTSIRFKNTEGLQAASSNWTEGILEFHFDIFFIGSGLTLEKIRKVSYISKNSLKNADGSPKVYNFSAPIKIAPWEMDKYGDRWKVVVIEYDPGTVITRQVNHSTTVGSNFSLGVKDGPNFGASAQQQYQLNTTTQTTLTSNDLGEAILNWTDPVLIAYAFNQYFSNEVDTGSLLISFEPVKK